MLNNPFYREETSLVEKQIKNMKRCYWKVNFNWCKQCIELSKNTPSHVYKRFSTSHTPILCSDQRCKVNVALKTELQQLWDSKKHVLLEFNLIHIVNTSRERNRPFSTFSKEGGTLPSKRYEKHAERLTSVPVLSTSSVKLYLKSRLFIIYSFNETVL